MDDAATRSDWRREEEDEDEEDEDDAAAVDAETVDGKWRRPAMRDEDLVDGAVKDRESAARRTMEAAAATMGDGVFMFIDYSLSLFSPN